MGMLTYLQELKSYLESEALPAAARPTVDASAVGAAIGREYTRPALQWWMERYSQSAETPGPLREAMAAWLLKEPQVVAQWFAAQPESPQRDALRSATMAAFAANRRSTDAAGAVADIRDAAMRQQAVEQPDFLWTARDLQGAAAWRARRQAEQGGALHSEAAAVLQQRLAQFPGAAGKASLILARLSSDMPSCSIVCSKPARIAGSFS